jgi:hypothetical protein
MNRFAVITAAALTAGGMGYAGCDRDDTARNTPAATSGDTAGDKVDRAMDRAGDAMGDATDKTAAVARDAGAAVSDATREAGAAVSDAAQRAGATIRGADKGTAAAPDAEGIRDILASVTEAALTENGLNDLAERLVDADRNRLGEATSAEFAEHAALVKQFRADWQAKYGKDFDFEGAEETALPDAMFTVREGEIVKGPAGAEVDVDRNADGSTTVDVDAKSGVDSPDTTAADSNRNDPGRNVATVEVKASHGMPALSVPLIHEAPDNWRIDVPDSVDANKLKQNVLAHLKAAHAAKDQWPADVNQAYGAVAHHVLMALLDKPAAQQ